MTRRYIYVTRFYNNNNKKNQHFFLKNFAGIYFCELALLNFFVSINFGELAFFEIFAKVAKIVKINPRKVFPLKLLICLLFLYQIQ